MNRYLRRRLGKFLCLLAIFSFFRNPSEGAENKLDTAIARFLKTVRTPSLKDQALRQQKILLGKDLIAQRKAVRFFADLHAKEVLLACLRSGEPGLRSTAADCLDVFGPGDLADLYRTAESLTPEFLEGGGENIVAREAVVEKLARRTSSILGIKDLPIKDFTKKGAHDWWANAAKSPGIKTPLSELEAALKPSKK